MSDSSLISSAHIDRLAELAVKTGLALQPGQDLMITAPIEALPLVRRITDYAYKSGAGVVTPIFSDPEIVLSRYRNAFDTSFDQAANWLYDGMGAAFDNNTARLAIVGDDPMLLANEDPQKVGRVNKANSQALTPARERITRFDINWNIVAWPGLAWAKRMFPDLPGNEAQGKLAEAIFSASRVNVSNPIEAWNKHNKNLRERSDWLNQQNFDSLHFLGPGTDLKVGLADGHEWMGGASLARNGITCNPNIPSEEVFTTPHCMKVQGKVSSTKPLSHQGTLIDNICVKFEAGSITEAHASKGEEVLLKVLDSDEGARRLGEVALVPHSSPISQSGLLFYNTLFDENAASHIALGQCYSKCFKGGENLSKDEIIKRGGNSSMIHIDWMIGSDEISVDGVKTDGTAVPVFRNGEWAG
ncbi:MAG: aminopeptidase [Paracoccaceae bacterium]|nr:aminopeptidase [Paracoccaceae bacterium]